MRGELWGAVLKSEPCHARKRGHAKAKMGVPRKRKTTTSKRTWNLCFESVKCRSGPSIRSTASPVTLFWGRVPRPCSNLSTGGPSLSRTFGKRHPARQLSRRCAVDAGRSSGLSQLVCSDCGGSLQKTWSHLPPPPPPPRVCRRRTPLWGCNFENLLLGGHDWKVPMNPAFSSVGRVTRYFANPPNIKVRGERHKLQRCCFAVLC